MLMGPTSSFTLSCAVLLSHTILVCYMFRIFVGCYQGENVHK